MPRRTEGWDPLIDGVSSVDTAKMAGWLLGYDKAVIGSRLHHEENKIADFSCLG